MDNTVLSSQQIIELLLPEEILQYFDLVKIEAQDRLLRIYLDEKANNPEGYEHEDVLSKGFYPEIEIQDFPLRRRKVLLCVRRRKWLVVNTGEIVSKSYHLKAEGTRYSEEFAAFLKGIHGFVPDQFDFT